MMTWNESLSLGEPMIDSQHRELLSRADSLLAAMREGRSRCEIEPLLSFLREYSERHLVDEAALMRAADYPDLTIHLAQHDFFTERLEKLLAEFREYGPTTAVAASLHQLVCSWFVKHITSHDAKLAAFLAPNASRSGSRVR